MLCLEMEVCASVICEEIDVSLHKIAEMCSNDKCLCKHFLEEQLKKLQISSRITILHLQDPTVSQFPGGFWLC